eukprot:4898681-Pleurochrysis_carterae.AAC.1
MHTCRSCACIACLLGALSPSAPRGFLSVSERMADPAVVPCALGPKTASGAPSPRARDVPARSDGRNS